MKIQAFLALVIALPAQAAPILPEAMTLNIPFTGEELPDAKLDREGRFQVALYTDQGAWDTGKEHMKMFLTEHGYTYQSFSRRDVLGGKLQASGAKLLMMPGGQSWEYLQTLGDKGAEQIKKFVSQGGSYFGVCAGAFYATSIRDGGYATGPYGIGLLDGTAYDGTAHDTAPFFYGMMDFNVMIDTFAPVFRIVLLGGPSFRYTDAVAKGQKIEVLSEFPNIHEPAMILGQYGQGKIFLSGPHIEIEEDRTDWGPEFKDPESDWPIMQLAVQRLLN